VFVCDHQVRKAHISETKRVQLTLHPRPSAACDLVQSTTQLRAI